MSQLQGRLEGVRDLHAADAVYHRNCHSLLVQNLLCRDGATGGNGPPSGRPAPTSGNTDRWRPGIFVY